MVDTVFNGGVDGGSYGIQASQDLANRTIDISSRSVGLGGSDVSTYTIIHGLSITGGIPKMPVNTDHQGFTFFTRPQLNLSYDNVINHRKMTAFADQRETNAANAIRCMLHPPGFTRSKKPIVYTGIGINKAENILDVRSMVVDDKNPFIPILSNNLITINGFPDFAPDVYTSPEGITKEQQSWIDDRPYQHSAFSITANFQNMDGNLVLDLFECWTNYAAHVAQGSMTPFPINVMTNRIDYNTRIYRFKMDRTKKFIQGIASTIAFPTAAPLGATFNFNHEERLNMEGQQISIPFQCMGVEYNDPILVKEFNQLVARFNPEMYADVFDISGIKRPDPLKMQLLKDEEKPIYSFKAYPFISETMELQWYVPIDEYVQYQEALRQVGTL